MNHGLKAYGNTQLSFFNFRKWQAGGREALARESKGENKRLLADFPCILV